MAKLIVNDGQKKRAFAVKKGKLLIGTAEGCALKLSATGASEKHCRISNEGDHWIVRDLGSEVGTKVNGKAIDDEVVLESGDEIEVPGMVIEFQSEDEALVEEPMPVAHSSGSSRSATSRGGGRRAQGRRPGSRKGGTAPSADEVVQHQTLRRARPKASSIPGWAVAVMTFSGAIVLVLAAVMILKNKAASMGPTGVMSQALELFDKEKFPESRAMVLRIEDSDGEPWVTKRDELLKKLDEWEGLREKNKLDINSGKVYQSLMTYRETNLKKNGKDVEDPAEARYYVEYLLDYYLETYGDGENAAEVRRLKSIYGKFYNESDPFPVSWHDVATIWQGETRPTRLRLGEAYAVMDAYAKANTGGEYHAEAVKYRDRAMEKAMDYLDSELAKVEDSIASDSFDLAQGRLNRLTERCSRIPEADARIKDMSERVDAKFKEASER